MRILLAAFARLRRLLLAADGRTVLLAPVPVPVTARKIAGPRGGQSAAYIRPPRPLGG